MAAFRFRHSTFPLFLLFLFGQEVSAGGISKAKYGSESLNFGIGGRALGLGGAYCALAQDVTAIYWNPAGLARLEFPQGMLMHASVFSGEVNFNFAGFALPLGPARTIGFGLVRVGVDDIPVTALTNPAFKLGELFVNDRGETVVNTAYVARQISDAEYAFYLSYAIKRTERWSYGGNVKVIHKGIGDHSAWGLGFDLSAMWNPTGSLLVGANFNDVTSTILAWDTGRKELLVPALRLGAAYPLALRLLNGQIAPAVDLELHFEGRDYAAQAALGPVSIDTHFGLEYQFKEMLAVRAGSDVGNFAAGVGIRLARVQIDYAFLRHQDLDNTHRISARLTIPEGRFRSR